MMKHMVMNILEAGKYDHSANIEIKLQRTHLPSLLENIWSLCAEIISKKQKVAAKIMLADEVPHYLLLDPQRIIQIFLNLVTNAAKFTDKGSIIIRITWETNTKNSPLTKNLPSTALTASTMHKLSFPYDPASFDDGMMREKSEDEMIKINETKTLLQPEIGYHEVNLTRREWSTHLGYKHQKAGTRGILKISVQDTGNGMTEAQCEKLFRRFSQVSDDEDKRQLGTGLGLWITKQIIEKLNGDISVDSKLGAGTRFDILLPTSVEDRIAGPSIEIPVNKSLMHGIGETKLFRESMTNANLSKKSFTRNTLPQERVLRTLKKVEDRSDLQINFNEQRWASTTSLDTPIIYSNLDAKEREVLGFDQSASKAEVLVVDDDPFNAELLKNFIVEKLGLKILIAQNGLEALEFVDHVGSKNIALALIDFNLKDMKGTQVIEEMKQITDSKNRSPIPCYIVSGEERKYLEELCGVSDNILGFLTKPLEFNELQQIILKHIPEYNVVDL